MNLSHASTYALQAVAYLAAKREGQPVPSATIARACRTPGRFLGKVVKLLVAAGILHSRKGPHGGYQLARPPARITVLEVIEAIEGPVHGEAPVIDALAGSALHRRLQAVCDRAAVELRRELAKVKISDLVPAPGPGQGRARPGR
jgi:Rrf2 family protein